FAGMIRLANSACDKRALVILGGPSLIINSFPFDSIDRSKYVIFLETKSLTPRILNSGIQPDYFLMFYPEKSKSNSFQHVVFQSILAEFDISRLIKKEFSEQYDFILNNKDEYFEAWRPERGPHKRLRYKPDTYLRGSPFDLLGGTGNMKIIAYSAPLKEYGMSFPYSDRLYSFDFLPPESIFDLEKYFTPIEKDGTLYLKDYLFVNSAAIGLFPLLKYMGFKKVYFLGMDMSMLGSMEYAACFTFKSMNDFGIFFKRAKSVFNASFKENRKRFMRPPYEFKALEEILKYKTMEFCNVFEPYEYALPANGIRNISYKEFINA
ncbi:MAG: hypothetical protein PHY94_00445, partial [Candidatus Omnitrophica bacterium]|nr:hypothetical protein [Candidatus Omnitrophota bacterium]